MRPRRAHLVPLGLAALAYVLALIQRPGLSTSDTKIDLHVDPVRFLADVAAAWSPTADLGHVQGGQYGGYLLPMGPWFAAGHLLGLPDWLVQRLWLGTILALAAWGTVRLLDALLDRPRGVAHVVAGLLILLNPYVVVFAARTTVTLLGYAALPWLLLCVHRGLRAPRSWWWPAAFALIVTLSGGGVNAAVTAWVLAGPILLGLYEWWAGGVAARAVLALAWRAVVVGAVACAWWVVPLLVQSRYGVDFLEFTEQPGTIWSTTSLSESLRLMGYWISYLGVGYGGTLRPYFGDGRVMLFSLPVVVAGLLVPALVVSGLWIVRRWRYAPFFLGLFLLGLLAMAAGFPDGTPLRRGVTFAYNHAAPLQFLRTSYKAGPLVALSIACLGGAAAGRVAWAAVPPVAVRWAAGGALVLLLAVACWPLATGRAIDSQLTWDRIPPPWKAAAAHVDATARDGRAVVLPGQLYAFYDWGGTIDPILPALADRPVAVRNAVPYADLRAVDLLWATDALVEQRRAVPGQLGPLLDLMSAQTVIAGADDDRTRSGAVPAAEAADVLDDLGHPSGAWGPVEPQRRAAGTLGAPRELPQVRAWDRPGARPLVRLEPDAGATVLDGSADGLAALAAFGAVPRGRLSYAADLPTGGVRRLATGGNVVISDSNRRQVLVASRMAQNRGPVLEASDPFSPDAAVLDPFPARGSDAQTVSVLDGAKALSAPVSPGFSQFPERRPAAALDGDPRTAWLADRALQPDRHWLEVTFGAPRDVAAVDLLPYDDARGRVTAVEIAGRTFPVHAGWNHLPLGLRGASGLRVRIASVAKPRGATASAGGIRELRVPGLRVRESLRPPVLAERALAGRKLDTTALTYLFQRTTGDDPFRRDTAHGALGAALVRDRGDAETGLDRRFAPPAARTWTLDGWASVAPDAPDPALDRLTGTSGGRFASSGRFEGRPGFRASSAFDGTARPWIGPWTGRRAWLEWTTPRRATIRSLRLAAPRERVRRPTKVRLWAGGGTGRLRPLTPILRVAVNGTIALPRPVRGQVFRLEVVAAAFPPGTPGIVRRRRAVGIGEVSGTGIPRAHAPHSGRLRSRCGELSGTVGGQPLRLAVTGSIEDLDGGRPLRASGCGAVRLSAGATDLTLPARTFAPYVLRLRSPAPRAAPAAAPPGRVLDAGDQHRNAVTGIRLDVRRPAWLVLGEAFDRGWKASCDGHDLGAPQPVDAASMGWRVPAGCRTADLTFGPDRSVEAGYAISIVGGIVLIALLILRRRPPANPRPAPLPDPPPPARVPVRRAVIPALAAGAVLGFAFAARTAPLMALATFVVLVRGIPIRALLTAASGLLLVVVPVLTVAIPARDRGGYNPEYPVERIAVHWVTVAAVVLLILTLARWLSTARARRPAVPAAGRRRAAEPARAA